MADDKKVIFSMVGVSKIYPPQKQVLKDIYLSFFYGAKIGIIGLKARVNHLFLKSSPVSTRITVARWCSRPATR